MMNLTVDMSTKDVFIWTPNKHQYHQCKHHLMFMQILHWSGNHWLEPTPSHELPTQPNHEHFPLENIFQIINISELQGSCVYK